MTQAPEGSRPGDGLSVLPSSLPPAADAGPASSPARDKRSLDRSLLLGIAWTGGMRWATQILSWASTLVVARLLTPDAYGLVGMALVYVGFVAMIWDFGLSAAIVQRQDLGERDIARIGGLVIVVGVCFALISFALAGPIAAFFNEGAVRRIIIILGLAHLVTMFQTVPRAVLARELRFKRIAAIDGVQALALTAATLAFAAAGFGADALVFGTVVGTLVATPVALVARPHPLAWPRPSTLLAEALRFGGHVVGSRVAWYAYSNADFAIVGRVLGKAALGVYNFGWTIATIPVDRISSLVGQVMPGVFAAVQHDRAALRRYFLLISEGLALVTFPLSLGLALTADDFIIVALGEKWRAAIAPLRILALYAAFRSLVAVPAPILVAAGHARRNMHYTVLAAVVLPVTFLIGTRWGTTGVAMGWAVAFPLVSLPLFLFTFRLLDLPARVFARALWPAAGATLAMGLAVVALRLAWPEDWPRAARFGTSVALGALTYTALTVAFNGARLRAFVRLLRERGA